MIYSDLYIKKNYFPSRILVFFAVAAMSTGTFLYFSSGASSTRASKQKLIQHEIVNVTSAQIGVMWSTGQTDRGWIQYGSNPNNLDQIAHDEQDKTQSNKLRLLHYVVMKNLLPDTQYYYQIVTPEGIIFDSNKPFQSHTAVSQGSSGQLSPAYGKIISDGGKDISGVFMLYSIADAFPLLAITGASGEWLTPLQYVVNKKNHSYVSLSENTLVTITGYKDGKMSRIRTTVGKSHPLKQAVVLGQNYVFLDDARVLSAQSSKKILPASQSSPTIRDFQIRFPRDNSVIPGNAPLIKGYGIPASIVEMSINTSPSFSTTVSVDQNGEWDVLRVPKMAPGSYNLIAKGMTRHGKKIAQTRVFTLIKSGEMVLGETTATPSATLEPTQPVASITFTPTQSVTVFPTMTSGVSPTPVIYTNTSPVPPPPVSGIDSVWPYAVTGAGLLLIGAGLVLIF